MAHGPTPPDGLVCAECRATPEGASRRTWLGYRKVHCLECDTWTVLPMARRDRRAYWLCILALDFAVFGVLLLNGHWLVSLAALVVAVPAGAALVRDLELRRKAIERDRSTWILQIRQSGGGPSSHPRPAL